MEHRHSNTTNTGNLHIYQDDNTGNFYYWNGRELVLLGNKKPEIGDTGDKDFQENEARKRAEQIQKEKEEAQKAKEAGEDYDEEALQDEESEEERKQRIQNIQDILDNSEYSNEVQKESKAKVDKDLAKKKASDPSNIKNSKLKRFKTSMDDFIRNEIRKTRSKTWAKINQSYEGTGIYKQGRRKVKNESIPKINVYFDQSGSWGSSDIAVGMEALGVLKNYIDRNEIKMELFYFSNSICTTAEEARRQGGTGAGAELIYHIQSTHPDNVIIMTDDDIGSGWNEIYEAPKIKVNGMVWYLFRGRASSALPEWLRGRKGTRAFII